MLQHELSVGFYLIVLLMGQHTINRELVDFLKGMDSSLLSSVVATERKIQRKIGMFKSLGWVRLLKYFLMFTKAALI